MKFFLIALPLCLLGFSCERHDFEETKALHEKHGSHAGDHGGHDAKHEDHAAPEGGDAHGKKEEKPPH